MKQKDEERTTELAINLKDLVDDLSGDASDKNTWLNHRTASHSLHYPPMQVPFVDPQLEEEKKHYFKKNRINPKSSKDLFTREISNILAGTGSEVINAERKPT